MNAKKTKYPAAATNAERVIATLRRDAAAAVFCTLEVASPVPLTKAPVGLFLCDGRLGFKSACYEDDGRIAAFDAMTGTPFWGGARTVSAQHAVYVLPVLIDGLAPGERPSEAAR